MGNNSSDLNTKQQNLIPYIVNGGHQEEDDAYDVKGKDGSEENQHDDCAGEREREAQEETCYTTFHPLLCGMNITGGRTQPNKKKDVRTRATDQQLI